MFVVRTPEILLSDMRCALTNAKHSTENIEAVESVFALFNFFEHNSKQFPEIVCSFDAGKLNSDSKVDGLTVRFQTTGDKAGELLHRLRVLLDRNVDVFIHTSPIELDTASGFKGFDGYLKFRAPQSAECNPALIQVSDIVEILFQMYMSANSPGKFCMILQNFVTSSQAHIASESWKSPSNEPSLDELGFCMNWVPFIQLLNAIVFRKH